MIILTTGVIVLGAVDTFNLNSSQMKTVPFATQHAMQRLRVATNLENLHIPGLNTALVHLHPDPC